MQLKLELLAPAKNKDIGIAAIDCGADAVYIAGPSFGAREAAGNSISDIKDLVDYARNFSAKIFVTVNTILFDSELDKAKEMIWNIYRAGADAIIVQDLAITKMELPPIELHASTQAAIRTPEQAKILEALGFTRLILERELSIDQINAIRKAVKCELEFFVHGALCVCYSGQCYLSKRLTGRSANRGECAQACRSSYDLIDSTGKVIVKNRPLLSLKDYRLDERIGDLVESGICSFKIEGRLKNASYVKNITRYYRNVIDDYISDHPQYCKASAGVLEGGFHPDPDVTFNRGYTMLYIDGKRGKWNSVSAAKSMGKNLGTITDISGNTLEINTKEVISNGDGLAFTSADGKVLGMRAEVCNGNRITVKESTGLKTGDTVFRNLDVKFEHELEHNMPKRLISATINYCAKNGILTLSAESNDPFDKLLGGCKAEIEIREGLQPANNSDSALENIRRNLSKRSLNYSFSIGKIEADTLYFHPASILNTLRNRMAEILNEKRIETIKKSIKVATRDNAEINRMSESNRLAGNSLTFLSNCANKMAKEVYTDLGFNQIAPAYELNQVDGAELMRTKYCIKYELGLCNCNQKEPLYLVNNGIKLKLLFDCKKCEMIVIL